MPNKGDHINYGVYGICVVEDVRGIKFRSDSCERDYYVLKPVHQENTHIFVPTDSQALIEQMRPILSSAEIDAVIAQVKDQGMPWTSDWKQRREQFRAILSRRDERELLQLASCLYLQSSADGKGLSATDARVLKQVEEIIEQEFSFSLKINQQDIGSYIRKKLGAQELLGA